ncbi:hypothetical protein [Oricola sp.]|uniref:hypothetical protein n=1 Tax=Oricola sp. TaxID=1979950 RepID=UPI003BAAA0CC
MADNGLDARMAPSGTSANFSVWGGGVIPTGYHHDEYIDQEYPMPAETCNSDGEYYLTNLCAGTFGFGSDARFHHAFDNGYAVQLESLFDYHGELDSDDDSPDEFSIYGAAAGHLIRRAGATAVGVFAGVSATAMLDQEERAVHAMVGGEAASFQDTKTFFGQAGYVGAIAGEDQVNDLVFARGGIRFFNDPNSRLETAFAGGYTATGERTAIGEGLIWLQATANFEKKFDDNPFSVYVGYQGDYVATPERYADEYERDRHAFIHTAKIGLRMAIGGNDTLQGQDNNGARTFDLTNLRAPLSYPDQM